MTKQKTELKERFKPLRVLTRKLNRKKHEINRLFDTKKYGQEIEKLKNETKELEKQERDWFEQDTPKYLEELKKKYSP